MKLPAIPFLTKTVNTEHFLALLFESDKIVGILFEEQNKSLSILATQESKIDLDSADVESLVSAVDKVISKLEVSLPEEAVLEKTIFTVPHSWVEEGRITQDKLSDLKKISVELALSPVGFIVSIEAIVVFLQKKEGAPVNGIFVEISEKALETFIVRGGNIIEVKKGEILKEGVEKTVENLLESVEKLDVLPSKIILLNNEEGEKIQQKFLSYQWTKNLPFQHLPQVTILDRGFENEAIIHGVAAQTGSSIKGGIAVSKFEEISDNQELEASSADSFGFVREQDIKNEVVPGQELPAENKDLVIRDNLQPEKAEPKGEEVYEDDYQDQDEEASIEKKSLPAIIASIPSKISFSALKNRNIFSLSTLRSLAIPFAALVVVSLLLIGYYNYVLKAEIIIFTDQKEFNDTLGITLTTNGDSSFADKTLKIETVTEEVSGEDTQDTTGTLETGEKAKGELAVFNKTESPKDVAKGTTIVSSNGLEYTTDDEIKIASTSSFSTTFSSQKVKVTASEFGKEYNIPSNTNFTIKGVSTSDLFGRNDSAFSGGSKEEVKVVSEKDIQILSDTVSKKLFETAKRQASGKLGNDEALIPVVLSSKFVEREFDKKEDEKANSLKLSAVVSYTLGVYKKDELNKFIASSDEFDIPEDFELSDEESEISVSEIKQNNKDISAKLAFNAIFKPSIEVGEIPELIKGVGIGSAEEKIKEIEGVSDVTVVLKNKLPVLPSILPLSSKNISVDIKTQ